MAVKPLIPPPLAIPLTQPNTGSGTPPWVNWFLLAYNAITTGQGLFAPSGDKFILNQPDSANLPNAQSLSVLASGFLKVTTISGLLSSTGNVLIQDTDLSTTGVFASSYGSSTLAPVITVNAQGRITNLTTTTINGTSPGGSAGGDLTGSYPNPNCVSTNGISFANSATIDATNATNITTGILPIAQAAFQDRFAYTYCGGV